MYAYFVLIIKDALDNIHLFLSKISPTSMQKYVNDFFEKLDKLFNVFGGRNIALLALTIVITMGLMIFNDSWIMSTRSVGDDYANGQNALTNLKKYQANIYLSESAQRGYLLTKANSYIEPYESASKLARDSLREITANLEPLSAKYHLQKELYLVDKLTADTEAKFTEIEITLSFAKKGDFNQAEKLVKLNSGLVHMLEINNDIVSLESSIQSKLLEIKSSRDHYRMVIRASVIIGPLLLIFLVVLVIKALLDEISKKAEFQQVLSHENDKHVEKAVQQSNLLKSLALDCQSDVERERQKLARELHDELGSLLTAIKMDVSWVIKTLSASRPEITEKLKKTIGYLNQSISFKRQIVQDLHPSMISSFGFWPALNTLITEAAERGNLTLKLSLSDENIRINETISLVAYRVIQETLNNCNKYAKATEISLHIVCDDSNLKIEIQDNGVGIDLNALNNETHGLKGMRHRVLAIGGHFDVISEPSKGVLTLVILPLNVKPSSV